MDFYQLQITKCSLDLSKNNDQIGLMDSSRFKFAQPGWIHVYNKESDVYMSSSVCRSLIAAMQCGAEHESNNGIGAKAINIVSHLAVM